MVSDKRWKFVGNSGTSERARVAALFLPYKYWLSGPGKEALELRLAWRLSGPLLSLWTGDIPVQKWPESENTAESAAVAHQF